MHVDVQTVGPAFSAAALAIDDLLDDGMELGFPCVRRKVDVFVVEEVVDGVGTVRHGS
jgi:hypothetical protein